MGGKGKIIMKKSHCSMYMHLLSKKSVNFMDYKHILIKIEQVSYNQK